MTPSIFYSASSTFKVHIPLERAPPEPSLLGFLYNMGWRGSI